MKLSHSAIERLNTCGESYRLHYIEKIRPTWVGSALIFGDAIDTALRAAVYRTGNPYEEFMKKWTNTVINKVPTYVPTSSNLLYLKSDFDAELLTSECYASVDALQARGGLQSFVFEDLATKRSTQGWQALTEPEKAYYNYMNWLCLAQKAKYMLEAHDREILPNIKNVKGMQIALSNDNGAGDEFIGYIDMISEYEGYEGDIIFDYKSSSRPYKWNAVRESPQLARYLHFKGPDYNTRQAGYIVLMKKMKKIRHKTCQTCGNTGTGRADTCDAKIDKKRCHGTWSTRLELRGETQVLVQEISSAFEDAVLDQTDEAAAVIKSGNFQKNPSKCNFQFGDRCVFYDLCHKGSMHGLVKNEKS